MKIPEDQNEAAKTLLCAARDRDLPILTMSTASGAIVVVVPDSRLAKVVNAAIFEAVRSYVEGHPEAGLVFDVFGEPELQ